MTKEELVKGLNEIYGTIENFAGDETLDSAVKSLKTLRDNLGDIIQDVEDNGITEEEKETEKES